MGYRVEETIEADTKSSGADLVATRVNGESIEVLSKQVVPIGEWVAFELRLNQGDVFLEGMGRCEACASSGSGHRIRLGTLQFDVMNEVMFERVHLAAESLMTGERTGEVDIVALEALRKAELAPRPSPSTAPIASPPKIPAPMRTPSWRPPPPMRSPTSPSAPPRPKTPSIRIPVPASPSVQIPRPQISIPSAEPLAPIKTTRTAAEFSPSGYPPLPRPPHAPAAIALPESALPESAESPEPEESVFESVAPPETVEPVAAPEPVKPRTVSGFPAPPPEPIAEKPRSAPAYRSSPPQSSRAPAKGEASARERLEPLLLAMRRGGAARHLEDAEELAMELGLQALERIFGD